MRWFACDTRERMTRGECPRNRLIRTPDGDPGLNYLCSGLRRFFKHALPEVERIADTIRKAEARPGR